jgi:hypothetical protein
VQWGSEIDELIKSMMTVMKRTLGIRELLTAQLGALEYLYSAQANEKEIATLSSKLVQLLAFAKDIPFPDVLREGMSCCCCDIICRQCNRSIYVCLTICLFANK